jgi:long-chain fatty acid transport protein
MFQFVALALGIVLLAAVLTRPVNAQSFGVELHNTLMPAAGGMAGASIARPQDVQSALNGNPASMARFHGTQFGMSGAWAEATYDVMHTGIGALPGIDSYSAKSQAQGAALGNIAVLQDISAMGMPATVGVGLFASSGAGVSFRQVPESNGTSALIQGLAIAAGLGVQVTDRLSAGANLMLGAADTARCLHQR